MVKEVMLTFPVACAPTLTSMITVPVPMSGIAELSAETIADPWAVAVPRSVFREVHSLDPSPPISSETSLGALLMMAMSKSSSSGV